MITLKKSDYEKIIAHARETLPEEACGLIAGKEVNGAKRWIYVTESLSFQPSELVKLLMIIFLFLRCGFIEVGKYHY